MSGDDPENRWDDPEDRWGDPEQDLGPRVDVPSVGAPGGADVEVPADLRFTFWRVVILVNVGLLGVSLGAMFVYFEGDWRLGGGALAVGALTLGYAYVLYWRYQNR